MRPVAVALKQHPSICRSLLIPSTTSFSAFYAEQEQALHGYVRSMLPDRHEASEVMQEVGPPHSPRPIPVLTVPGAPGVTPEAWSKARTQRHTSPAAERRKLLRILHNCTD